MVKGEMKNIMMLQEFVLNVSSFSSRCEENQLLHCVRFTFSC